jgi:hypothetical protein
LTTAVIRRILRKGPENPQPRGRHQALDPAIESAILTLVLDAFKNGKGMMPKELLQMVRETDNPKLTKGSVHFFIGRHLDVLQLCRSLPQEDTRMTVPRAYLEQHIATMKTHIVGKFSELIFNLDEVGSSEWEDRRPRKVIAPRKFHRKMFIILLLADMAT